MNRVKTAMGKGAVSEREDGLRVSVAEMEEGIPKKPRAQKHLLKRITSPLKRLFSLNRDLKDSEESAWLKLFRRAFYVLSSAIVLAVIAVVCVNHPSLCCLGLLATQNLPLAAPRPGETVISS